MGESGNLVGVVASLAFAGLLILVLWALGAFSSASNNITCKQTNGVQYWLCIAGQANRQYVTYGTWRSARVGGYYDKGAGKVFRDVSDDPAAPHGVFGDDGGDSGAHGFSDGGDGAR